VTEKLDVKKSLDSYRARRDEFRLVDVPDLRYLMVDGHGDPNSAPAFREAVEALYPVAYALKFASKRERGFDYVVPPLEGLWWADDLAAFTVARDKSRWDWTLLLMVPDEVDGDLAAGTVAAAGSGVRLEVLSEGRCVQTLHVGSFDDEADVLARLHHGFVPDNGLRMVGRHHEIYLSDFRRVPPERRRTILRQPVARPAPSVV
jgi:hypothetical protein